MSGLPNNWDDVEFGELNQFASRTIDPANSPKEEFELYSVPSFPSGSPETQHGSSIGSTKQMVEPSDVLVCKINPRINRVWQVGPKQSRRQIASSEWIVMRTPEMDARFLRHFFTSPEFREFICQDVTGVGGSLTRAQPKRVATFRVPIAPRNEQKHIADKLDAVLARVNACRERLDRVPAILKRFRQSVLAAATSGKLTEEWREERRLKEWTSSTVGESSFLVTKGASPKWQGFSYVDDSRQTLFVTSENVGQGQMLLSEKKFVENEFNKKQARSVLKRGDVLTNIVGASIGRAAIYDRDVLANINQAVCVIRVDDSKLSNKFLMYFLNSPQGVADILGGAVEVARANVSLGTISNLAFKLPTLDEQTEIVRRVEELFAYADRLEARYATAHAQVEKLTSALLAKAFRGELVPQDPNDEPASVLLQRIRAARATEAEQPKRASKGKRKTKAEVIMLDPANIPADHLALILKRKGRMSAKALWQASDLIIEDFYEQLRLEEKKGRVREVKKASESYLEVA